MVGSPNFVRFVYDGDISASRAARGRCPARLRGHRAALQRLLRVPGTAEGSDSVDGRSDYGPFIAPASRQAACSPAPRCSRRRAAGRDLRRHRLRGSRMTAATTSAATHRQPRHHRGRPDERRGGARDDRPAQTRRSTRPPRRRARRGSGAGSTGGHLDPSRRAASEHPGPRLAQEASTPRDCARSGPGPEDAIGEERRQEVDKRDLGRRHGLRAADAGRWHACAIGRTSCCSQRHAAPGEVVNEPHRADRRPWDQLASSASEPAASERRRKRSGAGIEPTPRRATTGNRF